MDDRVDARIHRALADASRVRVLQAVRDAGEVDARDLARRVRLHPNTVRAHLAVLVEVGLVTRRAEALRLTPGRPRVLYEARDLPVPPPEAGGYALLAEILASFLAGAVPDAPAAAERAGHAWGRYLTTRPAPFSSIGPAEAVDRLTELQHGLGFEPSIRRDEAQRQAPAFVPALDPAAAPRPATEPGTEPEGASTDQAPEPARDQPARLAPEPATESVPDPAAARVPGPATAPARELLADPAPEPARDRLPELTPNLMPGPTAEAAPEPATPTGSRAGSLQPPPFPPAPASSAGGPAEGAGVGEHWGLVLHRCPYRAVADRHGELVCSLHLGLLRGILDELDAPLEASRLDPSRGPTRCVAHLRGRSRPPSRPG